MLALALTAALALSAPGTLDTSFGHEGRVVTPVTGIAPVAGVEPLPHGGSLVVTAVDRRRVVLIRYRRDGSIARRQSIDFDRNVDAHDTLLDSRGRLLVAGALGGDALLLRFDRAGHLDPTLDHDGIAVIDFGGPAGDVATSIALAPDGSILMAGKASNSIGGDLALTRLHADGSVDTSFGQQGFVRRTPGYYMNSVSGDAVAVLPDGRLVVVMTFTTVRGDSGSTLLRLLADGSPDPAFPGPWQEVPGADYISAIAVSRSTGRLFLGAYHGFEEASKPYLIEIDPNAKTPISRAVLRFSSGVFPYLSSVMLDRKGRALLTGTAQWFRKGNVPLGAQRDRAEQFVARFNSKGKLDRCFGKRGMARVRFPGTLSVAAAITSGPRDTIVMAGTHGYPDQRVPHRFELARLRGGGCR